MAPAKSNPLGPIIGRSRAVRDLIETIKRIAPADITVLISGESGTGKELAARAIHHLSARRDRPFIPINCGALTESLLESELFGHERGSFTGAYARTAGKFESADGGTLFLDEVGELSANTQVKLLRVLETGEYMRVGGSTVLKTDIRLIAASNRDLSREVRAGRFRQDLYYRLNIVSLQMPALRERGDDIPMLIEHFGKLVFKERGINSHGVTPEAMQAMIAYHWPGNIRELRNFVESMIVLNPDRPVNLGDFEDYLSRQGGHAGEPEPSAYAHLLPVPVDKTREQAEHEILLKSLQDIRAYLVAILSLLQRQADRDRQVIVPDDSLFSPADFSEVPPDRTDEEEPTMIKEMEKEMIGRALEKHGGNRARTARDLGIGVRTLYRKIKEYNL